MAQFGMRTAIVCLAFGFIACGGVPDSESERSEVGNKGDALTTSVDSFESNVTAWKSFACSTCSMKSTASTTHAKSGATAMQLTYSVSAGGWAGVERILSPARDWSAATELRMSFYGVGTGRTFVVQAYDAGWERWETSFRDTTAGWRTVALPLSNFTLAGWQPSTAKVNKVQDWKQVNGISISASGVAAGYGTIWIDDLTLETLGSTQPEPPPPPSTPLNPPAGSIVALYTYPTHAMWANVVTAKKNHPTVDIVTTINPNSGPGARLDLVFSRGVDNLKNAGIRVIGYVPTDYGNRSAALVKADIDKYRTWYPKVEGIFFDEMSNSTTKKAYYQDLQSYVRSKSMNFTVGNPGADVPNELVGTLDVVLIYERSGQPSLTMISSHSGADPKNLGIIPYAVPTLDKTFIQNARSRTRYIYVTDDNLPNPWDTLPSYFDGLLGALE